MTKEQRKDRYAILIKQNGNCGEPINIYCGYECPLKSFCDITDASIRIEDDFTFIRKEALKRYVRKYGKEDLVEVLI